MKIFLVILLVGLIGAGFYGYRQNPSGCKKLGNDFAVAASTLTTDVVGVYTVSDSVAVSGRTPAPFAAVSPVTPASSVTAPLAAWTPPTSFPSTPNWTWTTPSGTFNNVRILKVEADCVTILHADGGGLVPIATLPPDLRKALNYDPVAASAAALLRQKRELASSREALNDSVAADKLQEQKNEAAPREALAQEKGAQQFALETTDYSDAVSHAKTAGKLVLLHFTGSDWCGYCKLLDSEVLSTAAFQQFSAANYILVTLDFPHDIPLPDSLKQQNAQLAQKYGVQGYPTLVVIDGNEKELGRTSGYNPGTGASAVIAELQGYNNTR